MERRLTDQTHRRGFLGRLAAITAAGVAGFAPSRLVAQPETKAASTDPNTDWLSKVPGKHRQFFDMPNPSGGLPQIHILNYLNTYREAHKAKPSDVKVVASLYFMTTLLAFNDEMWAKYKFGEILKADDLTTKSPAVRNVFWKPREGSETLPVTGMIGVPNVASMASLQEKGTLFLLCNNAFNFWVGQLAGASGDKKAVRAELEKNIVPGVVIVPAMVVAINQAQQAGMSYIYQA